MTASYLGIWHRESEFILEPSLGYHTDPQQNDVGAEDRTKVKGFLTEKDCEREQEFLDAVKRVLWETHTGTPPPSDIRSRGNPNPDMKTIGEDFSPEEFIKEWVTTNPMATVSETTDPPGAETSDTELRPIPGVDLSHLGKRTRGDDVVCVWRW